MRPAGGEQAGQASSPRVLVLVSWPEQEVSGRRREAPRWLASGLVA